MRKAHYSRRVGLPAIILATALALTSGAAAAATPSDDDGSWYFDRFLVQDAHDAGITGEDVTIAMIDSPVNLEIPTLADADIRVQESTCIRADGSRPSGVSADYELAMHGTGVLSLLVGSGAGFPGQTGVKGLAPDATVLTYYAQLQDEFDSTGGCPKTTLPSEQGNALQDTIYGTADEIAVAMHAAMDAGADIISVSKGAPGGNVLAQAVARAVREGVIIVAALPNEDNIWGGTAPASSNGVVSVNSFGADGQAHGKEYTDVTGPGHALLFQGTSDGWQNQALRSGTSLATPIVAGNLALAMQKYPEATPNQLIQSLIHNTGAEPHDLGWDPVYGYGIVITDRFLAVDPTQYPDVNPLVSDFADLFPRVDDIWLETVPSDQEYSHENRPWPVYTPEPVAPSASPLPSSDDSTDPTSSPTSIATEEPIASGLGWLVPAIISVLVLVAVAITITIVMVRARKPRESGSLNT